MYILELTTGKKVEVIVKEILKQDFEVIKRLKKFSFDWSKLRNELVYKLVPAGANGIVGLVALIDHPDPGYEFIEIKLIESAKENVGKNKKYDRITGILLAYACREAFKKGYHGTVFLVPKTGLIQWYMAQYGFKHIGRGLYLDFDNSIKLVNDFLDNNEY